MAATVALAVYAGVNLLALHYVDERNGLINEDLAPNTDHWPVARQILAGEELTAFRYPPGFALYIAAAVKRTEDWGGTYFVWRLVDDSLSAALTAAIVMALMWRLTRSAWCAWVANIVLLYNVAYSAGTASDLAMAAFLPWFFGSVLLLVQGLQGSSHAAARACVSGLLLAIAGFLRPDILLFLPFIGGLLLLFDGSNGTGSDRQRYLWAGAICFAVIGFSIVVFPWTLFASRRHGALVVYSTGFIPSHIDGMARFPGNAVSETFRSMPLTSTSLLGVAQMHLSVIRSYPLDWLGLWARKLWQPWYMSDSQRWNWVFGIQTLALVGPVAAGAYLWIKKKGIDLAFVFGAGVICYFWSVTLAVLSINRYMAPVYPVLGMFAGFAAEALWKAKTRPTIG